MQPAAIRTLIIIAASVLSAATTIPAHAQHSQPTATEGAAPLRRMRCPSLAFPIRIHQSLDTRRACSAVRLAAHEVAKGGATTLGVLPTDSTRIVAAGLTFFHFRGLMGAPDESYWSVSIAVRGRAVPLSFRVATDFETVSVTNGETFGPMP